MRNESCRNCVNFSEYEVTRECLECFPNGKGPKYFKQKEIKKTNADRIREMTDEALAELLAGIDCYCCAVNRAGCCDSSGTCIQTILDWLKKDVEI